VDGGPHAENDSATTSEDTPVDIDVLANDHDPEGQTLTVVGVVQPGHGTALHDGTTVTYTPNADFCGPDTFGYTISDGTSTAAAQIVPVVVLCTNDPPTAVDDTASAPEDGSALIEVLANDSDIDGDAPAVASATDPAHGSATVTSTNRISYVPDPGYCGPDTFDYTIRDPDGITDTASVAVAVTCVDDPPVPGAIATQSTPWGQELSVPVPFTDTDSAAVSVIVLAGPGSVVDGSSGSHTWTWMPTDQQIGTHQVTLRISDSTGHADTSFAVTVTKRATTIDYGGDESGEHSDPATVSAVLVDVAGQPVAGVPVALTIGSTTTTRSTDASGVASGTVLVAGPAGPRPWSASFAGDARYLGATESGTFTVGAEDDLSLSFTGTHVTTTSSTTASAVLKARLLESDSSPGSLAGLGVTFRDVATGAVLCTTSVGGPAVGSTDVACTASALDLRARAVVVTVNGSSHSADAAIGAFVLTGTSSTVHGAGDVDGASSRDHFAFEVRPGSGRKVAPVGSVVHARSTPAGFDVVIADAQLSSSTTCTRTKPKVCTATVAASGQGFLVDPQTGLVGLPANGRQITVVAQDRQNPDGTGSDTYGVSVQPDGYELHAVALLAGNVRAS
jgi:hypothetical protein